MKTLLKIDQKVFVESNHSNSFNIKPKYYGTIIALEEGVFIESEDVATIGMYVGTDDYDPYAFKTNTRSVDVSCCTPVDSFPY